MPHLRQLARQSPSLRPLIAADWRGDGSKRRRAAPGATERPGGPRDIPAGSAHNRQMKPALECRAKVHAALTRGATAIDPQLTLAWEEVAREWTALAVQAELYETLRAKFLDKI